MNPAIQLAIQLDKNQKQEDALDILMGELSELYQAQDFQAINEILLTPPAEIGMGLSVAILASTWAFKDKLRFYNYFLNRSRELAMLFNDPELDDTLLRLEKSRAGTTGARTLTPWRYQETLLPHEVKPLPQLRKEGQLRWHIYELVKRAKEEIPKTRLNYNVVYFVTLEMLVELLRGMNRPLEEPEEEEEGLPYTDADLIADNIQVLLPQLYDIAFQQPPREDWRPYTDLERISREWLDQALALETVDEEGEAYIPPEDIPLSNYLLCAYSCVSEIILYGYHNRDSETLTNSAAFSNVIIDLAQGTELAYGTPVAIEVMELWWARIQARLTIFFEG